MAGQGNDGACGNTAKLDSGPTGQHCRAPEPKCNEGGRVEGHSAQKFDLEPAAVYISFARRTRAQPGTAGLKLWAAHYRGKPLPQGGLRDAWH